MTTTIMNLIESEKAALPSGKQDYGNISVVGFSQGGAAAVAVEVMYTKSAPLDYIIAYAGWQPVNVSNWATSN